MYGRTFNAAGMAFCLKAWPNIQVDDTRDLRKALEAVGADMSRPLGEHPVHLYVEAVNLKKIVALAKAFFVNFRDTATESAKNWFISKVKYIINHFDCASPGALKAEEDKAEEDKAEGKEPVYFGYTEDELVDVTRKCLALSAIYDGTCSLNDQIWLPMVHYKVYQCRQWVLVDETQDLTVLQMEFVSKMLMKFGRAVFVGDEFQAIYEWRGAMSTAMADIGKRFNTANYPLNETYRCAKAIVREAQVYVPDYVAHESNAEGIVDSITMMEDLVSQAKPGDAIISRTRAPMFVIAKKLIAAGKRVNIRGNDLAEGLKHRIEVSGIKTIAGFRTWVDGWQAKEENRLSKVKFQDEAELGVKLEALKDNAEVLRTLCEMKGNTGKIQDLHDLVVNLCERVTDGSAVLVLTGHASKGREWDRVFMIRPTFKANKGGQERNLTYVAITRAKNHLTYVDCKEFQDDEGKAGKGKVRKPRAKKGAAKPGVDHDGEGEVQEIEGGQE